MSTRNIKIKFLGSKPYHHLLADCPDNVGSLTSHNPIGLHGLLRGWCYFFTFLQFTLQSGHIDPRNLDLGISYKSVVSLKDRLLYPQGAKAPSTHWRGGWVGPRTGLDNLKRRKILPLLRQIPNLQLSSLQPVPIPIVLS
jgi:hypothetical protein